MNVLQIFAGGNEGSIVGGLLLHVPEISHTSHALAVGITADGGGIGNKAEIEGLPPVERLQNHSRIMLQCIFTELVKLFAEIIPGLHRMRHARLLSIEGRHHYHTRGTDFPGSCNEFTH